MQKQKNAIHKGWKPTLLTSNILLLFFILLFLSFVLILYSLTPACPVCRQAGRQAGEADLNERHTNIPLDENEVYNAKYSVYNGTALLTVSAAKRNFPEEISLLSTIQHTTELEQMFNEVEEWGSLGEYRIMFYCPEFCCNGKWAGHTASGAVPTAGRTIAVDSRVIPYGSIVRIDGHEYVAEDTGGTVRRTKTIDILVSSHSEALKNGVQKAEVWVKK